MYVHVGRGYIELAERATLFVLGPAAELDRERHREFRQLQHVGERELGRNVDSTSNECQYGGCEGILQKTDVLFRAMNIRVDVLKSALWYIAES